MITTLPERNEWHFRLFGDLPEQVRVQILIMGSQAVVDWPACGIAPYWRLYCNDSPGMFIRHNETRHPLLPDTVYLVPPYTRINPEIESTVAEHLYIHFTFQGNRIYPRDEILALPIPARLRQVTEEFSIYTKGKYSPSMSVTCAVSSLVLEVLASLPETAWESVDMDDGILRVVDYMHSHFGHDINNDLLAGMACMARNSFIRKFKETMGVSPQRFLEKIRLDTARILLAYSTRTIDEIASECGFVDRFYFTTRFKKAFDTTPARYRKSRRSLEP